MTPASSKGSSTPDFNALAEQAAAEEETRLLEAQQRHQALVDQEAGRIVLHIRKLVQGGQLDDLTRVRAAVETALGLNQPAPPAGATEPPEPDPDPADVDDATWSHSAEASTGTRPAVPTGNRVRERMSRRRTSPGNTS